MKIPGETIPTRLRKEPLIDAVAEIRFTASVDASLFLPGLLLQKFPGANVERLPAADMPEAIRQMDESLRFQPVIRVFIDGYFLMIGTGSIAICCVLPYRGWNSFKTTIISVFEVVAKSGFLSSVTRCSMKYSDVLAVNSVEEALIYLDLKLTIAGEEVHQGAFNVQIQRLGGDVLHMVQAAVPIQLTLIDGSKKQGALLSIDSVSQAPEMPVSDFVANMDAILERIHSENKTEFFSWLTQEAMSLLEAEYV